MNRPKLEIELVPQTCWYSNVRTNVSKREWEICKDYTKEQSGGKCQICGGRGRRWATEAHEIWDYDDERMIQMLVGLIALCPQCHEVKHIGRAEIVGNGPRALAHLAKVNGWTIPAAEQYLRWAGELWALRSQEQWTLDITFLGFLGIDSNVSDRSSDAHPKV